jgi:hypothetical protein
MHDKLFRACTTLVVFGLLAMAFTHRSRPPERALVGDGGVGQGGYCPVRPPAGPERTALSSTNSEARMTPVPRIHASVDSATIVAESLLAPAPAICRPAPDSTPAQSSVLR